MKIMAFILTLTVLFLAFKPGVDMLIMQNFAEQSCCVEKCSPETKNITDTSNQQSEEQESNCCNPFQNCCAGFLPFLNDVLANAEKPSISTKEVFHYQNSCSSLFTKDFWQPPQFV